KESVAYRRGYLCGMIRGDGTRGRYNTARGQVVHGFRLALTDVEALMRTRQYLGTFAILTSEFSFGAASQRPMRAVGTPSRSSLEGIEHQIRWPQFPCRDWMCGFLAGIFDAEGSYSRAWRVSNTDPEIISWTTRALDALGFSYVLEPTVRENGLTVVRL